MDILNLPTFDVRTRQNPKNSQQEIWDTQRRRWVKLTPEEWVRQHFVHFLIEVMGYPSGRIGNEVCIRVGQLERRCDSVVFGDEGEALMIVEYKATSVRLTQDVFDQVSRYNIALQVDWLVVSNGIQHYCCHLNREANRWEFLPEIPSYPVLTQR
ncbi:MAG: type I restriction enzyme HsdR N-terminal domain-containing protein [Bacteroidales bacterium]|nr:type I restriction enzyme HsdR N-terminal domain-containing protein [Bacteroidales bacterium]